jgi:hypothetical protein
MTNCAFGLPSENWAALGVVSASAAEPALGPDQVQTVHGATSTAWQTPAGTTDAWLQIDAGEVVEWGALGLFATNLTPLAGARWRLGNDPTFAAAIYDSGLGPAGVAAGYRQALHVPPAPQFARYFRVDLTDPTNAEGVLRVAQAFGGPLRRPERNFAYETAFARGAAADVQRSRGGQAFVDLRYAERAWRVSLAALATAEVWPLVQEIQRTAEPGGNLLFLPFPTGADLARDAVFGRLLDATAVTWPVANAPHRRAWSATITERL